MSVLILMSSGGRGRAERTGAETGVDCAGALNPFSYFFSSAGLFAGGVVVLGAGLTAAPAPAGGVASSELQPTKQTRPNTRLESIAPTLIPNFTDALLRKSP